MNDAKQQINRQRAAISKNLLCCRVGVGGYQSICLPMNNNNNDSVAVVVSGRTIQIIPEMFHQCYIAFLSFILLYSSYLLSLFGTVVSRNRVVDVSGVVRRKGQTWNLPKTNQHSQSNDINKNKMKLSNDDNKCKNIRPFASSSTVPNTGFSLNRNNSNSSSVLSSSFCSHRIRILFLMLIISTQCLLVSCMLDALKALFILTGASTYLVTKYVNITQQQGGGGVGQYPATGPMHVIIPGVISSSSSFPLNNSSSSSSSSSWMKMAQWPKLHDHLSSSPSTTSLSHQWPDLPLSSSTWLSTSSSSSHSTNQTNGPMILTPGGIDFLKGDQQTSMIPQPSLANQIRPIYVLAIEEEEDERHMPKSLLNLSITTESSSKTNQNQLAGIEVDYILDAKMDDYAQVLKFFALNRSSGELFLIRPLDRDPPNGRSNWRFSIQARNRKTQFVLAIADVAITVGDINDNKPLFEQKLYKTTLMENGPAGQVLTKLHAIDFDEADTSDNGKILYSLVKTPLDSEKWTTDLFQIDPHTGVLTVLGCCFDREKRPEYRLVARATDAGGLSDETKIIVTIGDLNDNPPKFLNPSRTLRLDEISDDTDLQFDLNYPDNNQQQQQHHQQQLQQDENIYTFYISDEDLPESNHHTFEIINSTECPLFERFYFVVNADGSGTLYGTRRNETELKNYSRQQQLDDKTNINRTVNINNNNNNNEATCHLVVVVRDSVRDSITSSGTIFEDQTTLTLIYQFGTALKQRQRKQHQKQRLHDKQQNGTTMTNNRNSSNSIVWTSNNTGNASAVIAPDHFIPGQRLKDDPKLKSDLNDGGVGGPKAYDLSSSKSRSNSNSDNGNEIKPKPSGESDSNGADNLARTISNFDALKKWLGWSNKNFILFSLMIIAINLLVLISSGTYCLLKRSRPASNQNDPLSSTSPEELMMSPVIANANYYQIPTIIEPTNSKDGNNLINLSNPLQHILEPESSSTPLPLLPQLSNPQQPQQQRHLLDGQTNILISYELSDPTATTVADLTPSSSSIDSRYLDLYKSYEQQQQQQPHAQIIKSNYHNPSAVLSSPLCLKQNVDTSYINC